MMAKYNKVSISLEMVEITLLKFYFINTIYLFNIEL